MDGADEVRHTGVDCAAVRSADVRHDGVVRVNSGRVETTCVMTALYVSIAVELRRCAS